MRTIYRPLLILGGIPLLIVGIGITLYFMYNAMRVSTLDSHFVTGFTYDPQCRYALEKIQVNKRVMSENESQALTAVFSNIYTSQECEISVTLSAPDFNVSPLDNNRMVVVPPGKETARAIWIASPKKLGDFQIAFSSGATSISVGVTVLNVLGLNALQAQLLSYLTTFFGSAFTLPWLYSTWIERQKEKKEKASKRDIEIDNMKRQLEELKKERETKRWWQFWK